jgi:hypothetical protein
MSSKAVEIAEKLKADNRKLFNDIITNIGRPHKYLLKNPDDTDVQAIQKETVNDIYIFIESVGELIGGQWDTLIKEFNGNAVGIDIYDSEEQ